MKRAETIDPRRGVAEAAARVAGRASRLLGRGAGSSLPGKVLLALAPGYLNAAAQRLRSGVVLVSGTNGKTTTASMLRAMLAEAGLRVMGNPSGANLRQGIATALLDGPAADIAVFEVDEAVAADVGTRMEARLLVLTNVFRDQLDRYGETETVAALLAEAARALGPRARVVYNGDDPLLTGALAAAGVSGLPFGLRLADPGAAAAASVGGEPEVCPSCRRSLSYRHRTLAHLGDYGCSCGFAPPRDAVIGEVTSLDGLQGSHLRVGDREHTVPVGGVHNAYNAVAALVAARELGVEPEVAGAALARFRTRFGRAETFRFRGADMVLVLIKNPAGADAVLSACATERDVGAVVVAINDGIADGVDVSWIWDAAFELLVPTGAPLIATGRRAWEVALRLKHAGRAPAHTSTDLAAALEHAASLSESRKVLVLANYTAMLEVRRLVAGSRRAVFADAS